MNNRISQAIRLTLVAIAAAPAVLRGNEPVHDPLFHIERSKNANIVQYDARLGPDGLLDPEEPVVAYWIRLANEGEIKELSWVQKTFAYGFTAKLDTRHNTATLDMAADFGRTVTVKRDGEDYRAIAEINGESCYLDRIFIHATGKGITTRVEYIELYGTSVTGRGEQYERFSP